MGRARPHILIVRLGAIGDVVNSILLLRLLRRRWPEAWIGWVVHPLSAPLLERDGDLDELFVLPQKRLLPELRLLRRRWRAIGIDWAIDISRTLKSGFVAWATGAPRRVAFDFDRSKEGNWLFATERIEAGDPQEHVIYHYLDMARHLGAVDEERPVEEQISWDIALRPDEEERVEGWLRSLQGEGRKDEGLLPRPIVLNLGASKPANRWSVERWAELARRLSEAGERVCLCGGPGDRPAALRLADRLSKGSADFEVCELEPGSGGPRRLGERILDLVGHSGLGDLAALFARSRLFVGCDTGPMHLAVAMGCPVVALFGPANPRRTGPWGNEDFVVSLGLHCGPCRRKRCRRGDTACMAGITVDRVWETVQLRLRTSKRSV